MHACWDVSQANASRQEEGALPDQLASNQLTLWVVPRMLNTFFCGPMQSDGRLLGLHQQLDLFSTYAAWRGIRA